MLFENIKTGDKVLCTKNVIVNTKIVNGHKVAETIKHFYVSHMVTSVNVDDSTFKIMGVSSVFNMRDGKRHGLMSMQVLPMSKELDQTKEYAVFTAKMKVLNEIKKWAYEVVEQADNVNYVDIDNYDEYALTFVLADLKIIKSIL